MADQAVLPSMPEPTPVSLQWYDFAKLALSSAGVLAVIQGGLSLVRSYRSERRSERTIAIGLTNTLEAFAGDCAHAVQAADYDYNVNGDAYPMLKVPKFEIDPDDEKWHRLRAELLDRLHQLTNILKRQQRSIAVAWEVDPGESALKESYQHVANCGVAAWELARLLRETFRLKPTNLETKTYEFVDELYKYQKGQ